MAAREDVGASKHKVEEEDSSPDLKQAEETAALVDVDEWSEDDDPVIRNLNLIARRNLMTPEWVENRKKQHYELHALLNSVYDALENGEIESDSEDEDEAAAAATAERSKRLWASVDWSRINTVDGEDAVAVYPAGVYPPQEGKQKDHDAPAAESSRPHVG
jgi:hypothetical protein